MARKTLLKDKPEGLLKEYKKALQSAGVPVERLIMFGSYAQGKARYDSDLDVGVVSKLFGKNGFEEMVMLSKIATNIEPLIEPHPLSPRMLDDKWDSLAQEIKRYGKDI